MRNEAPYAQSKWNTKLIRCMQNATLHCAALLSTALHCTALLALHHGTAGTARHGTARHCVVHNELHFACTQGTSFRILYADKSSFQCFSRASRRIWHAHKELHFEFGVHTFKERRFAFSGTHGASFRISHDHKELDFTFCLHRRSCISHFPCPQVQRIRSFFSHFILHFWNFILHCAFILTSSFGLYFRLSDAPKEHHFVLRMHSRSFSSHIQKSSFWISRFSCAGASFCRWF